MAHEAIIDLYERTAVAWDAARRRLTREERPHIEALADALPARASILDIGCGTGVPATLLIDRGFTLTGIDSSPTLIALCRKRFPDGDWRVADMRTLDLDRRFAAILAWFSFFHLSPDDQRAMFTVFARHAAPGALLVFTSADEEGVAIGEWEGEPLYHASLAPDENCALLAAKGFEVLSVTGRGARKHGISVWTARKG